MDNLIKQGMPFSAGFGNRRETLDTDIWESNQQPMLIPEQSHWNHCNYNHQWKSWNESESVFSWMKLKSESKPK